MQLSHAELELCVLRAQAGDERAFGALVTQHEGCLRRHALRHLGDHDLARDATQDAWIAIVRGLRRLEDPARFLPWALRIVAARAVDLVRRRRRTAAFERAGPATAVAAAAAPEGGEGDGDPRVLAAVRELDVEHRIVIELRYLEGLGVAAIAEVVGAPTGTVKSRLHYARGRLRERLQSDVFIDDDKE